jgi:hypothetical protein
VDLSVDYDAAFDMKALAERARAEAGVPHEIWAQCVAKIAEGVPLSPLTVYSVMFPVIRPPKTAVMPSRWPTFQPRSPRAVLLFTPSLAFTKIRALVRDNRPIPLLK